MQLWQKILVAILRFWATVYPHNREDVA